MKKFKLGNTEIEVTKVGFGSLTMGESQMNLPIEQGAEIIKYAISKGINFFDTAEYYRTYPYLVAGLKGTGSDIVISSKSLSHDAEGMRKAIEDARKSLNRDVIDIFLMHEVRTAPDFQNRQAAWEELQLAKAKGYVKAIGVSTHHIDVTEAATNLPECDIIFPLINYASLGIRKYHEAGTCEEMAEAIKRASELGKGIFGMKAFGGGNLTNTYQKSLDYVYSLPGITSMMIGFGKEKEVDDIIEYLNGSMDKSYNPDVTNKRIFIDKGDCEGCGACMKKCPVHAISRDLNGLADVNRDKCITCGYCAPVCPVRAILMLEKTR